MTAPGGAPRVLRRSPWNPALLTAATVVLLGALPDGVGAQDEEEDVLARAPALGWTVGEEDAPVTVVEFSDISCPYCAEFHGGTRAALIDEYVGSGQVRWITLSYVSGLYRNSEPLLVAAECAGRQGRYEEFVGAAYDEREAWLRAGDGEVATVVNRLARAVGVEPTGFADCRADATVRERLDRIRALAPRVGVRGTPTWIVNGFPVMGALPLGYARQFIESQLERGGG